MGSVVNQWPCLLVVKTGQMPLLPLVVSLCGKLLVDTLCVVMYFFHALHLYYSVYGEPLL